MEFSTNENEAKNEILMKANEKIFHLLSLMIPCESMKFPENGKTVRFFFVPRSSLISLFLSILTMLTAFIQNHCSRYSRKNERFLILSMVLHSTVELKGNRWRKSR